MVQKLFKPRIPVTDIFETVSYDTKTIRKNESQLLYGESFLIDGDNSDYYHGVTMIDGYEGFVLKEHLTPSIKIPRHWVMSPITHIYPDPDFKTRPVLQLSFLSRLEIQENTTENGFVRVSETGWIFADHIAEIPQTFDDNNAADGENKKDLADIALQFLGCPYLYGGRTAMGLDCSALVQLSAMALGIECPRDSDQQITLGASVPLQAAHNNSELSEDSLRRNDLVFFRNHVGIMVNEKEILNATSRTMDTRIEPLRQLIAVYGGIKAIRRI